MYGPQDYIRHLKKELTQQKESILEAILVGAQDYPHYRQLIGSYAVIEQMLQRTLDQVHRDMAKSLGIDDESE